MGGEKASSVTLTEGLLDFPWGNLCGYFGDPLQIEFVVSAAGCIQLTSVGQFMTVKILLGSKYLQDQGLGIEAGSKPL